MPAKVKVLGNQTKHLTKEEIEAREAAEESTMPVREIVQLKKPRFLNGNAAAGYYWKLTVGRMAGLAILDDLDSEQLGVYCQMLARAEILYRQSADASKTLRDAIKTKDSKQIGSALEAVAGVEKTLQALERRILQYAEKLGLTPTGRVHLARKRAAAAAMPEEADDLFGD